MKNKLKITKEQYNRIFASGLIKEHKGKLKITRDQYNRLIKESHMLGAEQGPDILEQERDALIRKFYRKTDEFSPFWEEHGLTYEDICEVLLAKGVIINKGAGYELSTKLGDPETAKQVLKDELSQLVGTDRDAPPATDDVVIDTDVDEDYPAGAQHASDAPYNQPDAQPVAPNNTYDVVVANNDLAILKNNVTDQFFTLDFWSNDIDYDGNDDAIYDFLNNNETILEKNGMIEQLTLDSAEALEGMYNLDPFFNKKLELVKQELSQVDEEGGVNWANTYQDINPEPKRRTNPENQSILDKLKSLKQQSDARHPKLATKHPLDPHPEDMEETTSTGGSSGAFTGPIATGPIKREIAETTDTTSTGNFGYDAPAIKGVTRSGKYTKTPKTKAEKNTQYPGGGFVHIDDCTKYNNNRTAIEGGCSQGAPDGVVKLKKTKANISAPSLGENKELYETIAKKTGKTPDEVKQIIDSKLNKG